MRAYEAKSILGKVFLGGIMDLVRHAADTDYELASVKIAAPISRVVRMVTPRILSQARGRRATSARRLVPPLADSNSWNCGASYQ